MTSCEPRPRPLRYATTVTTTTTTTTTTHCRRRCRHRRRRHCHRRFRCRPWSPVATWWIFVAARDREAVRLALLRGATGEPARHVGGSASRHSSSGSGSSVWSGSGGRSAHGGCCFGGRPVAQHVRPLVCPSFEPPPCAHTLPLSHSHVRSCQPNTSQPNTCCFIQRHLLYPLFYFYF